MENLSIITDFGCPFSCHFCVTNSQRTKKDIKNLSSSLSNIEKLVIEKKRTGVEYKRISVSGGGEPLFLHNKEIEIFYKNLFTLGKKLNIDIHVHTNILKPIEIVESFEKITISINQLNYIDKYHNWINIKSKRFVHVSDGKDLDLIKEMIHHLPINSQFTVKQMDDFDDDLYINIKEYVNSYNNCLFLSSGDYNDYYVLKEDKVYQTFKDIVFKR